MAVVTEYVGLLDLKEQLKIEVSDTTRDNQLNRARRSSSRLMDDLTSRRFYLDEVATARIYNPTNRVSRNRAGEEGLIVDDIGSVAGLVVEVGSGSSWTVLPATSYDLEPENALVRGKSITIIRLHLGGTWLANTGQRVRVTAIWGWPAVPDEVEQATMLQATRLFKRKDSAEGVAGSSDWGLVRVTRTDPDVMSLISHLVLPGFG